MSFQFQDDRSIIRDTGAFDNLVGIQNEFFGMVSFFPVNLMAVEKFLILVLDGDMSETNVSNPLTFASTAAPAPLSPAPKITILFIYNNVLLFSNQLIYLLAAHIF